MELQWTYTLKLKKQKKWKLIIDLQFLDDDDGDDDDDYRILLKKLADTFERNKKPFNMQTILFQVRNSSQTFP
jgi:hypothetical protein